MIQEDGVIIASQAIDEQISNLVSVEIDDDTKGNDARSLFTQAENGVRFSQLQIEQLSGYLKNPKAKNPTRHSVLSILWATVQHGYTLSEEVLKGLRFCTENPKVDGHAKQEAENVLREINRRKDTPSETNEEDLKPEETEKRQILQEKMDRIEHLNKMFM